MKSGAYNPMSVTPTVLINSGKTYHIHSGSVAEMAQRPALGTHGSGGDLDILNRGKRHWSDHNAEYRGESWFGVPSRQQVLDCIEKGWPDGRERIQAALGALEGKPVHAPRSRRRRKVWSDEGDCPDADRLRMGDYDRAYLNTRVQDRIGTGRHIRLFCNAGGNCNITSAEMFWAGAAAIRLTDLLEDAGYRVEVIYASLIAGAFLGNHRRLLFTTTIKGTTEMVNADQMASVLCLAGFFRTYGFYTICTPSEKITDYLGTTCTATAEVLAEAGMYEAGDIIVPSLRDQDGAQAFIQGALRQVDAPAKVDLPAPTPRRSAEEIRQEAIEKAEELKRRAAESRVKDLLERQPVPSEVKDKIKYAVEMDDATRLAQHKIVADGNTYPHRKELGRRGFKWTKGSPIWVSADTAAARMLMDDGLGGVTFTRL